jgi:hypothetical protein
MMVSDAIENTEAKLESPKIVAIESIVVYTQGLTVTDLHWT